MGIRWDFIAHPFGPLLDQLRIETNLLEGYHKEARAVSREQPPVFKYGISTPKEASNACLEMWHACLEMWPSVGLASVKKWEKDFLEPGTMPLLYFCARVLLAGTFNSTTYTERMHSPAACIFCTFRASLVPNNVEALTLALFYVRKWVKEKREGGSWGAGAGGGPRTV